MTQIKQRWYEPTHLTTVVGQPFWVDPINPNDVIRAIQYADQVEVTSLDDYGRRRFIPTLSHFELHMKDGRKIYPEHADAALKGGGLWVWAEKNKEHKYPQDELTVLREQVALLQSRLRRLEEVAESDDCDDCGDDW